MAPALQITTPTLEHLPWLAAHDPDVPETRVRRCITNEEYLIALEDGEPVGLLRFSWFWGRLPYMEMIYVAPKMRRQGVGSALNAAWEEKMAAEGATTLMTSCLSDEPEPRAWHGRNGYFESGRLIFGKIQAGPEVFFLKEL